MKTKKLWITAMATILLAAFVGGCKDEFTDKDGVCPAVISTNPTNLASNVPLDQVITVTFNEPMNPATITPSAFTLSSPAVAGRLDGSEAVSGVALGALTYDATTRSMTFVPTDKLKPNATYTGTVATTVKDLAGNALQIKYVWTFTTGGTPSVISTDPSNNTTNVILGKIITATFSTAMDPLTLTAATFTLKQGTTSIAGTVSYAGSTATFKPTSPLTPATIYTGTITTGAKSFGSTPLAANYVWTFNTGGSPTVLSTDPLDLAISIPLNKVVSAIFSEAMDPLTITGTSFSLKAGATSILGTVAYAGTTATFTPAVNLTPATVYTATITTIAFSAAGNPLATDKVWSFTTGLTPTVTLTDPINLATNVPLAKVISATFSEAMTPSTLNIATFTLKTGTLSVLGLVNYSGTTATFTPAANLVPGAVYTASITAVASSLVGIPLATDVVWTFTAAVNPTVNLVDPLDLAVNISLNKVVSATFSEVMDPLTLTTTTFTLLNGATPVLGAVTYSGFKALFTPAVNLLPGTTYTATVTTGAKSEAGSPLASNFVWTFTTAATPTVTLVDPLDLAIGVPLNKALSATFSLAMDPLTLTSTTFTLLNGATPVLGAVTYSGVKAIFTPTVNLLPGTIYTAAVTTGAQNVAGVPLAGNFTWTFTTAATPTVILADPLDLAIGIPIDKVVAATFSGAMDPLTLTSTTFTLLNGATPVLGVVTYSGVKASFTPSVDLLPSTIYTATVTTGAQNVAGVPLASNFVWTFTTSGTPTVSLVDPLNLAIGVAPDKVVSATFSVAMDPLTLTSTTFTLLNGATPVLGAVTYSGVKASFTPTANLLPGTIYTATVTTGAQNVAGVPLASNFVWTFTTAATPTVTLADPLNLASGVALDKVVSATFSVAMDPLTLTSTTFTLLNGATPVLGAVSYSGVKSSFTPTANLLPGTIYTATVTTGAKNVAGVPLASNFVWTFTTAPAPTVTLADPLNLAVGVALDKVVSATFSVAMDPLTLTSTTFTLLNGATPVLGAVTYSGVKASFTPTANLLPGTIYTATVTTGAKNVAGVPLASNFVWTFTTAATPTVTLVDPLNLAIGVPLNKVVSATFSVAMDPLTITTTTFTLKDGINPILGAVTYSGVNASFTPTSNLVAGTLYTAAITTSAKSNLGVPLATNFSWTFTTANSIPPTVTLTDPLNLATGVALNKVLSATFSVPMDGLTISTSTFKLAIGATPVAGSVNYSGSTATFTPTANLLSDNTYTATITTGAKNVAGTALASNFVWTFSTVAHLGPLAVDLKTVARFGIIAGVGVSNNAGFSVINDLDVGISPGVRSSVTGFPPATIVNGAIYASDDIAPPGTAAMLTQAKQDLTDAYLFAEGATSPAPATVAGNQGGLTLAPGIYKSGSTLSIDGSPLTLDAQGDVNAVWIFQIAAGFTTTTGGSVILIGGAKAKNVFWQVGSSAVIGDNTSFKGNVLALSSITMNTNAVAEGRMLARNASVVMTSTNIINKP